MMNKHKEVTSDMTITRGSVLSPPNQGALGPVQDRIYTRYRQRPFTLLNPQTIDLDLGWEARTLIVYNYTTQYLYLPDYGAFVPPNTAGVPFYSEGNSHAYCQWQAPPTVAQPAIGPVLALLLMYYERFIGLL